MHATCSPLIVRLMQLTPWMRYLLIAAVCHSLLLMAIALVRIAIPQRISDRAIFDPTGYPTSTAREVPSGTESSIPGTGEGGNPLAGGNTVSEYKPVVLTADARGANKIIGTVIGLIAGESPGVTTRPEGGFGGVSAPTSGFGPNKFGTSGVWGTGGNGVFDGRELRRTQHTSPVVERPVLAALRWLRDHQQPDGSWKSARPDAVSGLATLAFLGHGETADSPEFGPTLMKAFQYLVNRVNPNANLYDHAIVTYALAEGYGMTQSAALKEPLQRAVDILLLAQQASKKDPLHAGGWRYTTGAQDSDTSVTGWCVQALEAAKLAGANVPDSAFEGASKYLWQMYDGGTFGYTTPGGGIPARTSTTAIGVLCQAFMGQGNDPRTKQALDKLKTLKFDWNKDTGHLKCTTYMWYYLTQAMYHGGGAYWEHWNNTFRDSLIRHQSDDGHWDAPPQSDEAKYGPAYTTAICALMLEVYYRYLPTYQKMEERQTAHAGPAIGR